MAIASSRIAAPVILAPSSRWRGRPAQVGGIVALMLVAYFLLKGDYPWPSSLVWKELPSRLDNLQGWLLDQRTAENPNVIFAVLDGFRAFAEWLVTALNDALLWLTWVGTIAASTLIVLRFGGWRAALIIFASFASFALMGLWEESIQTLALMTAAVLLSLAVGIPLGVLAGRSERFHRSVTPALDAMQIVPAFAYLMPVVILFSVGPAAAVICTMIYAIPPAVRITALGIRGVTADSVEAARAFGSTAAPDALQGAAASGTPPAPAVDQPDDHVRPVAGGHRRPHRRPRARRRGDERPLLQRRPRDPRRNRDRDHGDRPRPRHVRDRGADRSHAPAPHREGRRRARRLTLATFGAIAVIVLLARSLGADGIYPDEFETSTTVYTATIYDDLLRWIQSVLDYVQDPTSFVFGITEPIGNFLLEHFLEPLRLFLVDSPWFVVLGGLTAIAFVLSGLRPAITTLVMLAAIGVMGVWAEAMDTASQVLVATALAVAVRHRDRRLGRGEPARGAAAAAPARHAPDAAPARLHHPVHLPDAGLADTGRGGFRALRDPGRDPAGHQRRAGRPAGRVEAAYAFGASRMQVLVKVKIPLARESIMLGVNQGIIMVLAVVVIGGLVGSGALGDMVARGLQRNEFGEGVVASLAILALGIALDRVTQGERDPRNEPAAARTWLGQTERTTANTMRGAREGSDDRQAVGRRDGAGLALFAAACGSEQGRRATDERQRPTGGKDCGKVVLNEQAWAGSTANTYIAKAVLEDKLGCQVEITKIAEIPVYQAMADGKTDAVLEDWQHTDEYEKYIDKAGTVVHGRAARRRGPHRLVHPEVPDGPAPRVRDLGGPEGQGGPVQDRRVRRPGHVPRRRSQLRPEGQGADRGARASTSST